ncbi:hypothetical protein FDP41_009369 [Naegleria fowleri]|uniref:Uncharacterized protein n=1 Tax=Naegleria fowleri TaxID=5763 RepID=A0A6A5BCQ9_NAEFO|nr:uncharacterized protein FDP41_009369 [Naegleria fowleri]KAF0972466.1 hypothetical protein FDP41_009369 [Naegleria fowleri]CAG4718224.1 unnamed protein product [Naegleria fowleri]
MSSGSMFSRMKKYDAAFKIRLLNDSFRRLETLKLYKEVLKFSKLFTWQDENGVMWGDLIKLSARQEIEASREEKDPQILAQALVNARMALDEMQEKFHAQQQKVQQQFTQHVNNTRMDSERNRTRSPLEIIQEREMMTKMGFDPNIHSPQHVNYSNIPIINEDSKQHQNIPILTTDGVWDDKKKN